MLPFSKVYARNFRLRASAKSFWLRGSAKSFLAAFEGERGKIGPLGKAFAILSLFQKVPIELVKLERSL